MATAAKRFKKVMKEVDEADGYELHINQREMDYLWRVLQSTSLTTEKDSLWNAIYTLGDSTATSDDTGNTGGHLKVKFLK